MVRISLQFFVFFLGCFDGKVRLVGGANDSEGRVEVCRRGAWTTVCDEGWDEYAARVICREIGLPHAGLLNESGCMGCCIARACM